VTVYLISKSGWGFEANLEDDTIKATTSEKNWLIMLSSPKQTKKYSWYKRNATANWSLMKDVYYNRTATGKYTATVQQLLERTPIGNDEEDRIPEPASDDMVSADEDKVDLEELKNINVTNMSKRQLQKHKKLMSELEKKITEHAKGVPGFQKLNKKRTHAAEAAKRTTKRSKRACDNTAAGRLNNILESMTKGIQDHSRSVQKRLDSRALIGIAPTAHGMAFKLISQHYKDSFLDLGCDMCFALGSFLQQNVGHPINQSWAETFLQLPLGALQTELVQRLCVTYKQYWVDNHFNGWDNAGMPLPTLPTLPAAGLHEGSDVEDSIFMPDELSMTQMLETQRHNGNQWRC